MDATLETRLHLQAEGWIELSWEEEEEVVKVREED